MVLLHPLTKERDSHVSQGQMEALSARGLGIFGERNKKIINRQETQPKTLVLLPHDFYSDFFHLSTDMVMFNGVSSRAAFAE